MSDDTRAVITPFGPGVSLYPPPRIDTLCERRLLLAVWERATSDAAWLDELETWPRSVWTKYERDYRRDLLNGIIDPRTWLAEVRAA